MKRYRIKPASQGRYIVQRRSLGLLWLSEGTFYNSGEAFSPRLFSSREAARQWIDDEIVRTQRQEAHMASGVERYP